MGRPRPWLAAVLAFFYPGLGHVYLREWARALLWFFLGVGTVAIALPEDALEGVSVTDPGSFVTASDALVSGASTLGLITVVVVFVFSIVDAYTIARGSARARARAAEGPEAEGDEPPCPHCGRPLDADLDFCHWCTSRLDGRESE